jgi:hypothetical protein
MVFINGAIKFSHQLISSASAGSVAGARTNGKAGRVASGAPSERGKELRLGRDHEFVTGKRLFGDLSLPP